MFENPKPIAPAHNTRFAENSGAGNASNIGGAHESELLIGSLDSSSGENARRSEALRMMEWSELTARLSAARDLRLLLRRDAARHIAGDASSFADAAADYFRTRNDNDDHCEPGVNPVALGPCKGSAGMKLERREINRRLPTEEAGDPDQTESSAADSGASIGDAREY